MTLHLGESEKLLPGLPSDSIDAIVTDPPYGLSFMGKKWDYDVPSVELWREVFRVLKPGGHLLSFGGTRTYHRMVVNIEDAGFEVRDQIMWIYGSGFPKSTNVALRIDKELGATNNRGQGFNVAGQNVQLNQNKELRSDHPDYKPPTFKTEQAQEWAGFGTALKPANEPIVLARKPLEKGLTVAENVLKWGTGALNIDGTRIGYASEADKKLGQSARPSKTSNANEYALNHGGLEGFDRADRSQIQGRWPANVLFDESAAECLPIENKQSVSRFFYVAKTSKRERNAGLEGMPAKPMNTYNFSEDGSFTKNSTAKSGEQVREARVNHHPTVKPIKLMEYLIKLITPPNGTVLDPFMGSGSTGCAAIKLGFKFIGIEREPEYLEIAKRRIDFYLMDIA
jgi:DNA modification methylase